MPNKILDVFDFDGTLIKVNSFKEINKHLILFLLKKFRWLFCAKLSIWYIIRKLHGVSHLTFKKHAVELFENSLSELEKRNLVQKVFQSNINPVVYDCFLKASQCVISTAAPYAYVSRIAFPRDYILLSSLDPNIQLPDPANFGMGKVDNLKARFPDGEIIVQNLYTDCDDDRPLMDAAQQVYLFQNNQLIKR